MEYGFVGCNLNPDPSGADWKEPPLTEKWWYPLYEKLAAPTWSTGIAKSAPATAIVRSYRGNRPGQKAEIPWKIS